MRIEWKVAQAGRNVGDCEDMQESVANEWIARGWVQSVPFPKKTADDHVEVVHSAIENPPDDRALRGAKRRG